LVETNTLGDIQTHVTSAETIKKHWECGKRRGCSLADGCWTSNLEGCGEGGCSTSEFKEAADSDLRNFVDAVTNAMPRRWGRPEPSVTDAQIEAFKKQEAVRRNGEQVNANRSYCKDR
jgi:hypothetical protein